MNIDHDRRAQILGCAVQILRDQPIADDDVREELSRIAERIEDIARCITGEP